jgi:hypothetical protein
MNPTRGNNSPLTSRLQAFETELLTQAENLVGLASINRELTDSVSHPLNVDLLSVFITLKPA